MEQQSTRQSAGNEKHQWQNGKVVYKDRARVSIQSQQMISCLYCTTSSSAYSMWPYSAHKPTIFSPVRGETTHKTSNPIHYPINKSWCFRWWFDITACIVQDTDMDLFFDSFYLVYGLRISTCRIVRNLYQVVSSMVASKVCHGVFVIL